MIRFISVGNDAAHDWSWHLLDGGSPWRPRRTTIAVVRSFNGEVTRTRNLMVALQVIRLIQVCNVRIFEGIGWSWSLRTVQVLKTFGLIVVFNISTISRGDKTEYVHRVPMVFPKRFRNSSVTNENNNL